MHHLSPRIHLALAMAQKACQITAQKKLSIDPTGTMELVRMIYSIHIAKMKSDSKEDSYLFTYFSIMSPSVKIKQIYCLASHGLFLLANLPAMPRLR